MPEHNPSRTAQQQREVLEQTHKTLAKLDMFTPSYFPVHAMIEMQKVVGVKPKSNPKPQRKQYPYTATELPRPIDGDVVTPSWFRYANMDGGNEQYGPLPEGYYWDVQYFRREDGSLLTQPALVELPKPPVGRMEEKVDPSVYTRSMMVQDVLTDEGLEDISSDEEIYNRGDHMFDVESSNESEDSEDEVTPIRRTAGLLAGDALLPARARAASIASTFSSSPSDVSATPPEDESAVPSSLLQPATAQSGKQAPSHPGNRVDSRHASTVQESSGGSAVLARDAIDQDSSLDDEIIDLTNDGELEEGEEDEAIDEEMEEEEDDELAEYEDEEMEEIIEYDDEDDDDWQD